MAERKPKSPAAKKSTKKAATKVAEVAAVETPVDVAAVETPVEVAAVETPVDVAAVPAMEPLPEYTGPVRRPAHDDIAARAYAIWRERGGRAVDNWLEAERQLGA